MMLVSVLFLVFTGFLSLDRWMPRELDKTSPDDSGSAPLELFLQWLIRLRWLVVLVAGGLILTVGSREGLLPSRYARWTLLAIVVVIGLYNGLFTAWASRGQSTRLQITLQMGADLLSLTFLLHFSGGLENPLYLLYLFHVILAGMIFRPARAFLFTTLAAGLFAGLGLAEYSGLIPHYNLVMLGEGVDPITAHVLASSVFVYGRIGSFLFVLYGTTIFTTLLSEVIRRSREHIRQGTERRKRLVHRLFSAQEEERVRIARDLHDQIGQTLSVLQLKSSQLAHKVDSGAEHVQELKTGIEDAIEEVRTLSSQIRPPSLEDCGFPTALANHVQELNDQYEVELDFEYTGMDRDERLPHPVDIALYRVAQEALLNAIQHSGTDRVSLVLHRVGEELRLLVEDQGKGFNYEGIREGSDRDSLGIQGMIERVEEINGNLDIQTKRGRGTVVRVTVDLKSVDAHSQEEFSGLEKEFQP